jgi:hypothetical protein
MDVIDYVDDLAFLLDLFGDVAYDDPSAFDGSIPFDTYIYDDTYIYNDTVPYDINSSFPLDIFGYAGLAPLAVLALMPYPHLISMIMTVQCPTMSMVMLITALLAP